MGERSCVVGCKPCELCASVNPRRNWQGVFVSDDDDAAKWHREKAKILAAARLSTRKYYKSRVFAAARVGCVVNSAAGARPVSQCLGELRGRRDAGVTVLPPMPPGPWRRHWHWPGAGGSIRGIDSLPVVLHWQVAPSSCTGTLSEFSGVCQ